MEKSSRLDSIIINRGEGVRNSHEKQESLSGALVTWRYSWLSDKEYRELTEGNYKIENMRLLSHD